MSAAEALSTADLQWLPANHAAIEVWGAASQTLIGDSLRLTRPLDMPGKGYAHDNPGACLRFATSARRGAVRLRYSDQHISPTARNGIGLMLVDDAEAATFTSRTATVVRPVEDIDVPLPVPATPGIHTYTVVMPYGDSVDVLGIGIEPTAVLSALEHHPQLRWVAYGDSVTQGFTSTHIGKTYPWLVARQRGWEAINLGLGGRSCNANDAEAIANLHPDLVTIAIGVNDWQGNAPAANYGLRLSHLIERLHALQPQARLAVITPLWVNDTWLAGKTAAPLADYRRAAEAAVASHAAICTLIDGATLIDPDPTLFDRVAVHPNDRGFAQMAERLSARLFPDLVPSKR